LKAYTPFVDGIYIYISRVIARAASVMPVTSSTIRRLAVDHLDS
jgi:hypothetical protein